MASSDNLKPTSFSGSRAGPWQKRFQDFPQDMSSLGMSVDNWHLLETILCTSAVHKVSSISLYNVLAFEHPCSLKLSRLNLSLLATHLTTSCMLLHA